MKSTQQIIKEVIDSIEGVTDMSSWPYDPIFSPEEDHFVRSAKPCFYLVERLRDSEEAGIPSRLEHCCSRLNIIHDVLRQILRLQGTIRTDLESMKFVSAMATLVEVENLIAAMQQDFPETDINHPKYFTATYAERAAEERRRLTSSMAGALDVPIKYLTGIVDIVDKEEDT